MRTWGDRSHPVIVCWVVNGKADGGTVISRQRSAGVAGWRNLNIKAEQSWLSFRPAKQAHANDCCVDIWIAKLNYCTNWEGYHSLDTRNLCLSPIQNDRLRMQIEHRRLNLASFVDITRVQHHPI